MSDDVKLFRSEKYIHVLFCNENAGPFAIGEKLNALNPEAYMNGYNWDALFRYYLSKHAPEVLEGLESDPEAGMFAAYYAPSDENWKKAEKFSEIITYLLENEDVLCRLVQEEGGCIEWD